MIKIHLGEFKVPDTCILWSIYCSSIKTIQSNWKKSHINLIKAYAMIKQSAAITNIELHILR